MYPTEHAVQTTVTDKIYSNGFIIRDENMIQNNTSGVLSYTASEKRILRCSEGKSIWYQIWIDPGDMMRIEPLTPTPMPRSSAMSSRR